MRPFSVRVFGKLALFALRVNVDYSARACAAVAEGGAVITANHVSLLDGVIVALASPRPLVFAVDTDFARRSKVARFGLAALARMGFGSVVPLDTSAPFGMRSLRRALAAGSSVMVFPEGRISPNGVAQPHEPGLNWLIRKTGATLVDVHIAGAENSKFFAKSGTQVWPKITLTF